jgi:L-fuconolactonase
VRIDAHVHLWNLERAHYRWLTPELGPLHRSFAPADLEPELRAGRVDAVVLVQAANERADTELMLELAETTAWIGAVVGWVPLDDPAATAASLGGLAGVRDLVHSERDPDWLLRPEVLESLRLLAERGLVFELPDSYPRDFLRLVPELADAAPRLRIVVDHLGKPPFRREPLDRWAGHLRAAAAAPTVYAKVSGLDTAVGADDWTAEELRPAFEAALDAFGPGRLLFGSDWPVSLLGGGYGRVLAAAEELVAPLGEEERVAILGGTAARLYGI